MAFHNGLGGPFDDLRSRHSHTNSTDYSTFTRTSFASPPQARATLPRRFTTDLSKDHNFANLSAHFGQPQQVSDRTETSNPALHMQMNERQIIEYQLLSEHRKKFDAELKMLELKAEKEKREIERMAREMTTDFGQMTMGAVSEPTTPPEYRESGFPSFFSRPARFPASSLTSPPGLQNRLNRSGSQITSPGAEWAHPIQSFSKPPAKSVPGSRRNSGEGEEDPEFQESLPHQSRSTNALNRYSMPATGFSSQNRDPESLGHINTTGFLFDDEDESEVKKNANRNVNSYLQMNSTDDKFPILVRRNDHPGFLSASSAALDLALSQSPGPEQETHNNEMWSSFARNRLSLQSLPQHSTDQLNNLLNNSPSTRQNNRHSLDVKLGSIGENRKQNPISSPPSSRPTSLQPSYSTNDIPTMKNGNFGAITPPRTHAEQFFHNHNASIGRIPPNAINRRSRDLSVGEQKPEEAMNALQSTLQASAAPFGPSISSTSSAGSASSGTTTPTPVTSPFSGTGGQYGGYGMMNLGMTSMQIANPLQMNNPIQQPLQMQNPLAPYQGYQVGRFQDSQSRVVHQRRTQNTDDSARFANVQIESLRQEIYSLCKDQHGCRYLQKKLEERDPTSVQLIFEETSPHVVELMTDPFGNYLCQKLLEFANDEQRTVLINNAAPQMVKIALNQHGTRALQKMIEFVTTREQIQTMILALRDRVVELVQDLNGNHVIQKCLTRLSSEDSQFIYEAVGANCVAVGTHRHGCCVLQRCIDHASAPQKAQLIGQITNNAHALVRDPFGNYVVQYILDLSEPAFTEPLCQSFSGSVPALSKQKFSSNVIEKCLRVADQSGRRMIIDEILGGNELERMLRDSFANYVVQTALEYADPEVKTRMVDAIRPLLPSIRHTPHGRRISTKLMGVDQARVNGGTASNDVSPPPQMPMTRQMPPTTHFQMPEQNGMKALGQMNYFGQGYNYELPSNGFLPDGGMNQSQPDGMAANFSSFPTYVQPSRARSFNYF
ncbi:MAG: hypothetical protein M1834_001840 [Cirrosporium novae-zelandiae]|nr:MAG: hypothetical protein M1834_001840 [Cirrosporium novae-zelandiae]